MMNSKIFMGQIVHYVVPQYMVIHEVDTPHIEEIPAVITFTGNDNHVSLQVFNKPWCKSPAESYIIDVPYSKDKQPYTWHFIED